MQHFLSLNSKYQPSCTPYLDKMSSVIRHALKAHSRLLVVRMELWSDIDTLVFSTGEASASYISLKATAISRVVVHFAYNTRIWLSCSITGLGETLQRPLNRPRGEDRILSTIVMSAHIYLRKDCLCFQSFPMFFFTISTFIHIDVIFMIL